MTSERNFKVLIPDNDERYFSLLEGVLDSVDEYSILTVTKALKEYHFRIVPSDATYINSIIKELLKLHNLLGLKINLGKSIKNSASISYSLSIFAS
jgi:hypothetical protein